MFPGISGVVRMLLVLFIVGADSAPEVSSPPITNQSSVSTESHSSPSQEVTRPSATTVNLTQNLRPRTTGVGKATDPDTLHSRKTALYWESTETPTSPTRQESMDNSESSTIRLQKTGVKGTGTTASDRWNSSTFWWSTSTGYGTGPFSTRAGQGEMEAGSSTAVTSASTARDTTSPMTYYVTQATHNATYRRILDKYLTAQAELPAECRNGMFTPLP